MTESQQEENNHRVQNEIHFKYSRFQQHVLNFVVIFHLFHQVPIVHIDRGEQHFLRVLVNALDQQLSILQRNHVPIIVERVEFRNEHPVRCEKKQVVFDWNLSGIDFQVTVLFRTTIHTPQRLQHGRRHHRYLGRNQTDLPSLRLHFDFQAVGPDLAMSCLVIPHFIDVERHHSVISIALQIQLGLDGDRRAVAAVRTQIYVHRWQTGNR